MTVILLALVLVLLVPVCALSVELLVRLRGSGGRERTAQNEADRAAAEAGRKMDEGFDNLMTYSVSLGQGRVSGGEP